MTMAQPAHLLICFDGSPGSTHAIQAAAELFPAARAEIATVCQPPLPIAVAGGGIAYEVASEVREDLAEQAHAHASATAAAGVELAVQAGLNAKALALDSVGAIWNRLIEAADELDVDVIVAGTRGWGEVRALLLGSTSSGLVHHSRRPIVVVPPAPAR